MHGNRIISLNPKFISSLMKQSEYFDEKILEKVNTENSKYYTLIEFDNALNELSTKKTYTCTLYFLRSITTPHWANICSWNIHRKFP